MADLFHPARKPRWPSSKVSNPRLTWVRQNLLSRLAAALWWLVMIVFGALIVLAWIGVAMDPSLIGAGLTLGFTLIVGIPILHEWPNARRMGRMLVHGT